MKKLMNMRRFNYLSMLIILVSVVFMFSVVSYAKTTVTFWQAGGTKEMVSTVRGFIDDFEKENPDITIKYQAIPWGEDPHFKYQTSIVGGTVADVISMGDPFQHVLAGNGALEPLDKYIPEETRKDFTTDTLNRCKYNGEL